MITEFILFIISEVISGIFGWLPVVTTLPSINGFDIDSALVSGMGTLQSFTLTFWPFRYLLQAFLFFMLYKTLMIMLRLILGARAG